MRPAPAADWVVGESMPAADEAPERPPAATQTQAAAWRLNKDERANVDAIDSALRGSRHHIPREPYIITIPQEEHAKYRHHYQAHALQWTYDAPFDMHTEHESIQYLTYHHYEPGKDMFLLHNSRPTYEPPTANGGSSAAARPGAGAPPPSGAPTKKISLDAYRKRASGGTTAPGVDGAKTGHAAGKQPAVKGPVERVKAETQEVLAAVAEEGEGEGAGEGGDDKKTKKDQSPEHGILKRKRAAPKADRAKDSADHVPTAAAGLPAKKAKVDGSPPVKKPPAAKELRKEERATRERDGATRAGTPDDAGLPPRLSPGLPPRLSPGPRPHREKSPKPVVSTTHDEDRLPPRLSPAKAQPGRFSKHGSTQEDAENRLPPRLSPTLPHNIAKTMEARAHVRSASQSSDPPTPASGVKEKIRKLTPIRNSESAIAKYKSPVPRNGFRANSSSPAVQSDAEQPGRPSVTSAARDQSPELSQDDEIAVGKALKAKRKPERAEKPSLLVKLKYKRSRREDVARILKMRSKPDKSMSQASATEEPKNAISTGKRNVERRDEPPAKAKGVAHKVSPVKKAKKLPVEQKPCVKVEKPSEKHEKQPEKHEKQSEKHEKRPLQEDDKPELSAKRRRIQENDKRKEPSTPASREVESPHTKRHLTPSSRKDLLSAAMKRERSQESNATQTPPALTSTPSTAIASQANGAAQLPSSQPSNKTPKQQAWETEQRKLEVLGRELKHSASAHLNPSQTSQTEVDRKLAAAKSVESFLCYLLAFTCTDEAAAAADPRRVPGHQTWNSLTGFYGFVKRNTESIPPLYGLTNSLGVVFSSHILGIGTQLPDAISPKTLMETQALLHKSATAADVNLDVDVLQEAFPHTWKHRTKRLPPSERLDPARLGGPYKLPLGVATTPVRAARAGYAMLVEWMAQEKVPYTPKLKF